jgi:uncharacterized membrane protein YqaE (UPF0057 family)
MKTTVILFLATLLFATSCSNKFSLVKRKYNKGFYVSVNKKSTAPQQTHRNEAKQKITEETVAVEVVPAKSNVTTYVPVDKVSTAPVAANNKTARSSESKKEQKENTNVTAAATDQITFNSKNEIKPVPAATKSNASDSEVHLVLLVILAILLPPLAVYLKHKTIDTWFWITLILTLLGYGLIFGAQGWGGAFALAAVVIALLYVFDVIK